jgi:MSHA pilin protein MshA
MTSINSQKKTQKGFTLIELVVVIVILGILAVTAAPKFIDLTGDARVSVMKGVKGSIESAVSMIHAKALVKNKTGEKDTVEVGSIFYALVNGYPAAAPLTTGTGATAVTAMGIEGLVDLDDITVTKGTATTDALFQHSGAAVKTTCQLSYEDAADKLTRPKITEALGAC